MNAALSQDQFPDTLRDWKYTNGTLWYEGSLSLLTMPRVSIVGSREVSQAGKSRTRKLTKLFVQQGFCIVSGLAKGVDTIAHQSALEMDGKTIAVMGTPIDQCYPKENHTLKDLIQERGLILTQFAPGAKVYPSNFPKRNELMAALSEITIVVEAGRQSGTRHQVKAAIRMKRRVAFLASMVDRNYPWVADALDSGFGSVIETEDDVVKLVAITKTPGRGEHSQEPAAALAGSNRHSGSGQLVLDSENLAVVRGKDKDIEVSLFKRIWRNCTFRIGWASKRVSKKSNQDAQ